MSTGQVAEAKVPDIGGLFIKGVVTEVRAGKSNWRYCLVGAGHAEYHFMTEKPVKVGDSVQGACKARARRADLGGGVEVSIEGY